MNGHQYEQKCAKMLKGKGFSKVTVTKKSGDQGIDVIAYSGGKKYGIQCKYYSSPVGNHAVQEVFAGARYYDCDVAVVMTNNTFTKSARELAKKTNVLLWEKNNIPLEVRSFWLTKWIGIFVCIVGILALITAWSVDKTKFPVSQGIESAFLILGGLLAVFEYGNWGMSLFSSASYLFATFINIMFHITTGKMLGYDLIFFSAMAFVSFIRADYLRKKVTGFHIWENGFRGLLYNNLRR